MKEPSCSPYHKAGLTYNTHAVQDIPRCKRGTSAGRGPGCGKKTLQKLSVAFLQAFGEGIPNKPDTGREERALLSFKGAGARHGERSVEEDVPKHGTKKRQHKANTESSQWLELAGTCSTEMKQQTMTNGIIKAWLQIITSSLNT